MKNILNKIKIDNITYVLMLFALLSGYIKNVFVIFIIVLIHELGHVFFFYIFDIEIDSINIYPFGGITKVNKRIHERIYKDILISLGGVLFQILLFVFFFLIYRYGLIVKSTYDMFCIYNMRVVIFNLIPIIPLDGSKLIFTILSNFISFRSSYICMIIISIVSFIVFVVCNFVLGINDLIIIMFLLNNVYEVIKNYKYIINKFYLERILYDNYYDGIVNDSLLNKMRINKYYYFYDGNKYINEKKYILKNKF